MMDSYFKNFFCLKKKLQSILFEIFFIFIFLENFIVITENELTLMEERGGGEGIYIASNFETKAQRWT